MLNHSDFINRLKGKFVDLAALHRAYPALGITSFHDDEIIQGTNENLERLWEAMDRFDHDGDVNTISDAPALSIANWLFAQAGDGAQASGNGVNWRRAAELGDQCINDNCAAHRAAIDETGIGLYYGDHSPFHQDILRGDQSSLQNQIDAMSAGNWRPASIEPGLITLENPAGEALRLRESSCIGWVMQNVRAAYAGAGGEERFAEISRHVKEADMRGTVLCEELQKDGWTAIFYSPRTADDLAQAGAGEKLGALRMAQAGARIWKAPVEGSKGVRCDVVITGYRDTEPDAHTEAQLEKLENVPFFVGVANGGIHTFVGHKGSVCDFHWNAQPDDPDAMTENPVRRWKWDTGLYMIPPGYW